MKKLILLTVRFFYFLHANPCSENRHQISKPGAFWVDIQEKTGSHRYFRIEALNLDSSISQTDIFGRENFLRNG
jgi:hypothetical protein